jgi:hypothetical protein
MAKILLAVAVLVSTSSLAGFAIAQGKQGEGFGGDVASLLAKLEAQCAHRRAMPPDPRDGCDKLRRDARLGYGQVGDTAGTSQPSSAAPGIGPGAGPGIGPGKGGGQGKGRR